MLMTVPPDMGVPSDMTVLPAVKSGANLLAMAADLLPAVVGNGPMLSSDLHASLYSVARLMPLCDDLGRAHLQADQAEELFATYLVVAGRVPAGRSVSHVVREWAAGTPVRVVARELRAAARFLSRGPERSRAVPTRA
jgi:hypothetical protein